MFFVEIRPDKSPPAQTRESVEFLRVIHASLKALMKEFHSMEP